MRKYRSLLVPVLLFLFTLLVYVHNLARGIYAGDVGDFVTTSFVGGIAHAPGYPLFVLLGFLISRLPIFPTPAFAVGLISALAGALCLVVLYFLTKEFTKNTYASILGSITLGVTFLFWFYSEVAEVFVLNALFIVVLFFLAIRLRKNPSIELLYLFCFFVGLSLTNHQTIIFIFPSLALLVFQPMKKLFSWKRLALAPMFFLLGFSLYLYPFIATLRKPIINWDPVFDARSFFRLILRQDYGTFNAGPFAVPTLLQRFIILKTYAMVTLIQLTIPVIVLSVLGIVGMWQKNRTACISFLLAFFFIGPVFIFYSGFPPTGDYFVGVLERFLLASQVIIFFFFPIGFVTFLKLLSFASKKRVASILFSAVFLLIPLQLFLYNFPKTDLSHFYFTEQFAKDMVLPLPPHAVLFTTGDTATFNIWYVRYALNLRKDVDLINLGALGFDTVYQKYVRLYLSHHPHEPKTSTGQLTAEVILYMKSQRPVFSLTPVQPVTKDSFTWIPKGLSYELLGNKVPIPSENDFTQEVQQAWSTLHVPQAQQLHKGAYGDVSAAEITGNYISGMLAAGSYFLTKYKDPKQAKLWFDEALLIDSSAANIHAELGMYYLTDGKQCAKAIDEFKQSIALSPLQIPTYILLYETYVGCSYDSRAAQAVATQFGSVFQENFSTALNSYFPKKKQ